MSATTRLPVADSPALRRYVKQLARRHPRMLFGALGLHVLAAVAALAAPGCSATSSRRSSRAPPPGTSTAC